MSEIVNARLTGIAPLLMHNGQLADPTNKWTKAIKEISSRRKKTEQDMLDLKKAEWFGSMYQDSAGVISISADMLLGLLIGGAKKNKNGVEAKAGVFETQGFYPLVFEGPKDLEKLYADGRFCDYRLVVVNRGRVMRSRPVFKKWSVDVSLIVDEDIIERRLVLQALTQAGERIGLGDYRPRFGRFSVEAL